MTEIHIRLATEADRPFLEERLLDAVTWDPSRPALSLAEALPTPEIAHYVMRWPGPRDAGVERANFARHLYASLGYEDVRDDGDAITMTTQLPSASHGHPR